jgi:hypothetical protein
MNSKVALKVLKSLMEEEQRRKHPNFPPQYLPPIKLSDTSANGLTKCIVEFLNLSGCQAERISTTGRWIDESFTYTNVMGQTRKAGSGRYIKGSGTKGSADISAIINGKSVKIEVKIGKDRQSEDQKKYQEAIERAGGIYVIAKDFQSFYDWYINFITFVKN